LSAEAERGNVPEERSKEKLGFEPGNGSGMLDDWLAEEMEI